jgi:RHS repeat-associated protein
MEGDEATGMAHTLWRQYDSLSARWTAPDPYGGSMAIADPQSFNRYTYVNNNPVNAVDPLGLMLQDIGVYQTTNPEVVRRVERAEDQGVKNWVAQQQAIGAVGSVLSRWESMRAIPPVP